MKMDRKILFWTGNDLNITVFILFLDFYLVRLT